MPGLGVLARQRIATSRQGVADELDACPSSHTLLPGEKGLKACFPRPLGEG